MKRLFQFLVVLMMVLGFTAAAHATLWLRGTDTAGNQLIYDDVLDITWYDYTTPYAYWSDQMSWVDTLTVDFGGTIYSDWRLPTAVDGDAVGDYGYDGTTNTGFNITTSEMGYLYYTALGNLGYCDTDGNCPQPGWGLTNTSFIDGDGNTGSFQNLEATAYWSDTTYSDQDIYAYVFYTADTVSGQLYVDQKDWTLNQAFGMMDGDIGAGGGGVAVPEPGTMLLLGTGLVGLGLVRRKFKR